MSSQTSSSASAVPSVVATDRITTVDDSATITSPNRWFFDKGKLESTPSRKCGIDSDKELTYRQQSANFIQDIGQRLQVNQLCINTAIVYMHRFYMFHSFSHFHRNAVSTASIFLAAKVEEQPRKLEHVIKVAHYCLHRDTQPQIDVKSEQYAEQSSELVMNENVLLQTLGFDVAIDHPHTHVVKCCQLVRASKDLAQTSYFMATNSLHLTTMCLQYKPTVVACVCIHLACKWSNWEIPRSKEGKDWFWYVDETVTTEQLESKTTEFLTIFNKSPSRLKKKMMSLNQVSGAANLSSFPTHLGLDPTSPGAPNFPKSRSPSPAAGSLKRISMPLKQAGTQMLVGKTAKIHVAIPSSHHGMKPHGSHHGPPQSGATKQHAGKPPYHPAHPPGFPHSAKDAHSQQQSQSIKDGLHLSHGKHAAPHNAHVGPSPYPHARPNAQAHHGQGHPGQKPPPPGSHPAHPYSLKQPSLNPSKTSLNTSMVKPLVPSGNINPNVAHQPYVKKPYPEGYGAKDDMINRRSGLNQHPPQSRSQQQQQLERPGVRHHPQSVPGQLPNSTHPPPHPVDPVRTWPDHSNSFPTPFVKVEVDDQSQPVPTLNTLADINNKRLHAESVEEIRNSAISKRLHPEPVDELRTAKRIHDSEDNRNSALSKRSHPEVEDMRNAAKRLMADVNDDLRNPVINKRPHVEVNEELRAPVPIKGGRIDTVDEMRGTVNNKRQLHSDVSDTQNSSTSNKLRQNSEVTVEIVNAVGKKRQHEGSSEDVRHASVKRPRSDTHASLSTTSSSSSVPVVVPDDILLEAKKSMTILKSPQLLDTRENRKVAKKSKKEKHKHKDKHKDKEEKKHKKDKHKNKDREKHKSRDKHRSSESLDGTDVKPACKLKISIGTVEKPVKTEKESKSKHSSSPKRVTTEDYMDEGKKMSSSSMKQSASGGTLKVKIVTGGRNRPQDEEPVKRTSSSSSGNRFDQHSQGQSTPCCPGFGPCTNPNCNQSQAPIKVKIPKEKIIAVAVPTPAAASRPKVSKETKKSKKEKEAKEKEKERLSVSGNTAVVNKSATIGRNAGTFNHGHKNGVEKVSRKRENATSSL